MSALGPSSRSLIIHVGQELAEVGCLFLLDYFRLPGWIMTVMHPIADLQ
jgi:hypothetical protein